VRAHLQQVLLGPVRVTAACVREKNGAFRWDGKAPNMDLP